MKKLLKWGAIGLVALIVLVKMFGGGDDKPAADAPAGSAAPAAKAPAGDAGSKDAPLAIGQPVAMKDMTWTVAAASDKGQALESPIKSLSTTGKFVQLEATVQNTGKDANYIEAPKIMDAAGREFDTHSEGFMFVQDDQRCILEKVNPGMSKACAWIYEVPADATGLMAAVKSGAFSAAQYVALGQ